MKKSICILSIIAIGILLFIPDIANAESVGVFSDVQNRFEQAVSNTSTTITNRANWLFWVLAAISLVWTGITLVFRIFLIFLQNSSDLLFLLDSSIGS